MVDYSRLQQNYSRLPQCCTADIPSLQALPHLQLTAGSVQHYGSLQQKAWVLLMCNDNEESSGDELDIYGGEAKENSENHHKGKETDSDEDMDDQQNTPDDNRNHKDDWNHHKDNQNHCQHNQSSNSMDDE